MIKGSFMSVFKLKLDFIMIAYISSPGELKI